MGNLEAGCKAFVINDPFVPENNWKVVELLYTKESFYNIFYNVYQISTESDHFQVSGKGTYWIVKGELTSFDIEKQYKHQTEERCYKAEQLMPLKGDFKIEQKATENSLSCV